MFGLTKREMRQIFVHNVFYWILGSLVTPVFALVLWLSIPTLSGASLTLLTIIVMLSALQSLFLVPVVFFKWYPASFYNDLRECPDCGSTSTKTVCETRCFSCGRVIVHGDLKLKVADEENQHVLEKMAKN